MRFKEMQRKVHEKKGAWKFDKGWLSVVENKVGNLCIVGRDWPTKALQPVEEAYLVFTPDERIIIPTGDVSCVLLGSFGVSGKLLQQPTDKTVTLYRHNLMYDYEVLPGMELELRTGKPIGMRKLEDITVDPKLKVIAQMAIAKAREPFLAYYKLKGELYKDAKHKEEWSRKSETHFGMLFAQAVAKPNMSLLHEAAMYTAWKIRYRIRNELDVKTVSGALFDRMVKKYKSAVFRHYGALT